MSHPSEQMSDAIMLILTSAWIIRAYLSAGIDRDTAVALQFYEGAFRILERGREVWKDVPLRDRGIIFEETFIRGLRVLLAQEHMNVRRALLISRWVGF